MSKLFDRDHDIALLLEPGIAFGVAEARTKRTFLCMMCFRTSCCWAGSYVPLEFLNLNALRQTMRKC